MIEILKFSKNNCAPCVKLANDMAEVDWSQYRAAISPYNVSIQPELIGQYQLTGAPTLVFEKDGEEFARLSGYITIDMILEVIK